MIFYTTRRQFHINREKGVGWAERKSLFEKVSVSQLAPSRGLLQVGVLRGGPHRGNKCCIDRENPKAQEG